MRDKVHITWHIGRPYIHRPFHPGLPTWADWKLLLCGLVILAFGLSHWIVIGEYYGWRVAVSTFAAEAVKEIKESWK
jgi:hypothetical protein